MVFLEQRLLDGRVILNNSVVDDGQLAVERVVRMGVYVVGFAVRRPARVPHTDPGVKLFVVQFGFERRYFSLFLVHLQALPVHQGHARAVVAPVFEPFQAFYHQRARFPVPNVCHNAAHS